MSVRRRGNGLTADSYVLLLDVDPRLADPLLAALATAGVAAYTTPTAGRPGPLLETGAPTRPREAVHVDSTRRPAARRVLEQTLPDVPAGLPTIEEEDSFAALVAGWNDEPGERGWPASEDLDPPTESGADGPGPTSAKQEPNDGPPRRRRSDRIAFPADDPDDTTDAAGADDTAEPLPRLSLDKPEVTKRPPTAARFDPVSADSVGADAVESSAQRSTAEDSDGDADDGSDDSAGDGADDSADDLDHYEPPPLEPLPPSHPVTKWGLVALGVGLVLLIFPRLLGLEQSNGVIVVGVLSIIGAVGLLVSRLSDRSTDDYDGPDDGAVV